MRGAAAIGSLYIIARTSRRKEVLMSKADIEKVKIAESEADKIKKTAHEEAADIIAEGKKKAIEMSDTAKRKSDEIYKSSIEKAEAEAAKTYQETIGKETKVCDKIKADGRNKLGEVADFIVRKVVDTDGNS